jgi:hypothetical protein
MTNIRYLLGVSDRDLRALGLDPEKRDKGDDDDDDDDDGGGDGDDTDDSDDDVS